MSTGNAVPLSTSLVDEFGKDVKDKRRDCNVAAAKSMTLTLALATAFCFVVLVRFWIV